MSEYKLILPSMGEGIIEASIIKWLKEVGDYVKEDDLILEVATDKIDSELPSPKSGKLIKKLKKEGEICQVGEAYAILQMKDKKNQESNALNVENKLYNEGKVEEFQKENKLITTFLKENLHTENKNLEENYISPLVKSICNEENISLEELKTIKGSGLNGRITKEDILNYLATRKKEENSEIKNEPDNLNYSENEVKNNDIYNKYFVDISAEDEIIEMDRVRKLIAEHMSESKKIAAHVTSFQEADLTKIVKWRNRNKSIFFQKYNQNITYMPIFISALIRALKDFPLMNVFVQGDKIIKKQAINIGMAAALPNGNLIVPVIKKADHYSLVELAIKVNDLANRARNNQLKPEEVKDGTFTISNVGGFNNLTGTPIINQPQVGIIAVGAILKKPSVIETDQGDFIGIRHKMMLAHTYDHRVIDGALGGPFLNQVCSYLESFNEIDI